MRNQTAASSFSWSLPSSELEKRSGETRRTAKDTADLGGSPLFRFQKDEQSESLFEFSSPSGKLSSQAEKKQEALFSSGSSKNKKSPGAAALPPKQSLTDGGGFGSAIVPFVANEDGITPAAKSNQDEIQQIQLHQTPNTAAAPKNSNSSSKANNWIIIFGFTRPEQYLDIMERFQTFGTIVSCRRGRSPPPTKTSSPSTLPITNNWLALQFQTPLETAKALCQSQPIVLRDGKTLAGVAQVTDSMLQHTIHGPESELAMPLLRLTNHDGKEPVTETLSTKSRTKDDQLLLLMPPPSTTKQPTMTRTPSKNRKHLLTEDDILITSASSSSSSSRKKSRGNDIIYKVLAYTFGWD